MNSWRIWDPIYGRIDLTEFEEQLLMLPEVQRLRYVRMCNINSLFITGASEVSRFEHTVGVLHLAREWAGENGLDDVERNDLLAAAVLHDVFTGPFGHSFQYVLEDAGDPEHAFAHEDIARGAKENYYMQIREAAQFSGARFGGPQLLRGRWDEVSAIIDGSAALGPLISGTMDLDNLDNVVRLAYHSGLACREDVSSILRLVRGIKVSEQVECLRVQPKVIEDVIRWQAVRKRLYDFLLLDWGEFAAKAMLTRAVERAVEGGILGTNSWSHTDDEFWNYLEKAAIGDYQDVAELIRRLKCGELYWPMLLASSKNISTYERLSKLQMKNEIANRIEEAVLRPFGMSTQAIFHLILDVGKTQRAVMLDVGEGRQHSVGINSSALLVGVFLARPWSQGAKQLRQAKDALDLVLAETGLGVMRPLEDPMGEQRSTSNDQLLLI